MKKRKNTIKLSKQKIASLEHKFTEKVMGGTSGKQTTTLPTTTTIDRTAATLCYNCPSYSG